MALYLENNRAMMPYDVCLREGLPIGSGLAESACHRQGKDRTELTGMRRRTEFASAEQSIRAVYLNGDWEEFQQAHRSKELDKLYPDRKRIMAEWPEAALRKSSYAQIYKSCCIIMQKHFYANIRDKSL